MYTSIEQFLSTWSYESDATQKLLDLLTDASLAQRVSDEDRTMGRLAWHLVTTIHEMISRTGLEFSAPEHDAMLPSTAKEIADGYRQANTAFIEAIQNQWTDANLQEETDMYGEMWSNAATLDMLVKHQIHHRAQMTVLMRQAGLPVIGVYGPSRDEWDGGN